ncbi:acyl-CoA dehydrogenase domain protein [Parafrankia sp. EAN1pec]|uniref:acyl-CoA dehydrogenase family protein n=1 Tax=Parafrankia sp. (strain EAN1pec) TaxID=298653 RepID=UPI0000540D2A|nr:acyl-CoA dehydrogenase domain protein [Frankia sp. EAN1pec]
MSPTATESLDGFRDRARKFIRANLEPAAPSVATSLRGGRSDEEELAAVTRDRELQRLLFDAGLAGICFPREYGGQGLTPAHQAVLNDELGGYEYPSHLQSPSISQCGPVLLEFGTEEQKREHIPALLRGDEIWMQFLSEPGSGSDVAAALTSAVRDGDDWVLNGSKIWTTGAWWSDWALCLARSNWDVPKHRGLTVFMVPIRHPGIKVHRIELLSGSQEFCQEFMTDVRIPDAYRIGEVDGGWTVGVRWMFHERLGTSSPLVTLSGGSHLGRSTDPVAVARATGRLDDPTARDLIGEARTLELVGGALSSRLASAISGGQMSDQAAAIGRLFSGVAAIRRTTIVFELAGAVGAAWTEDDGDAGEIGTDFLMRQVATIAGGTTEMARNVISERVLGMPRERTVDRELPFRDVPRSKR